MSKYTIGIVGGLHPDTAPDDHPRILREEQAVALLEALAPRPLPVADVDPVLLARLLRLEALRVEDGRVCINFPFQTRADIITLLNVGNRAGASLAQCFLDRRAEFERLFGGYPLPHVSPAKLAFAMVGGYFLDLHCLSLLKQEGYMAGPRQMPGGNAYTLTMDEACTDVSLQGVYWGCHRGGNDRYIFSTFGDHAPETRRQALPDLVWSGQYPPSLYTEAATLLESAGTAGLPVVASPLVEMGYLTEMGGRLHVTVPFFAARDTELLGGVFRLARGITLEWLAANYRDLEQSLANITCLRHGLPMAEAMIQIWHYIFGQTNRHLARAGFILDTYQTDRPGYLPAVYPTQWANFAMEDVAHA